MIFIVFIRDKIWHRYTRRPHYSGFTKFGELIVVESPLIILSKEFLKHPLKEIKYYFKYSIGVRVDKNSGAKVIRPIIIFSNNVKSGFLKKIDSKIILLYLRYLKVTNKSKIYFITFYTQRWLINKKNKRNKYILEMNDEWSMIEYDNLVSDNVRNLTYETICQVDLVLTVTKKLQEKYCDNSKGLYLPNAVNINHYVPNFDIKTKKIEEESLHYDREFLRFGNNDPRKYKNSIDLIKDIKSPAIGSISGLSGNWSDFGFMTEVEELLPPEYNLISTGNIFPPTKQEFLYGYNKYMEKKRTKFLGHLDYAILPDFLEKINVGLVMHRMDEFNTHSAPNKIWAYLAMGIPVVSTNFLNEPDKEVFEGMVCFANSPKEYVDYIISSFKNDNLELKIERRNLAIKNSTENRAQEIVNFIKKKFKL